MLRPAYHPAIRRALARRQGIHRQGGVRGVIHGARGNYAHQVETGMPTPTPPPGGAPGATGTEGSQIPGQGAYLQNQAMAERAYAEAMASLQTKRGSLYNDFGLLPGGAV